MTDEEVARLHPGDEVLWTDPNNGELTQYVTIRRIQVFGDVVQITHTNGDLECFAEELS